MPRRNKAKATTTQNKLDDCSVCWALAGSHPAQGAGMFQHDPTSAEFCDILRQQREEDYRQTQEAIDVIIHEEEEIKRCSSSTPTPSRTTKTRTRSSAPK